MKLKKKILVTGGAGYIGSKICYDLIDRGFDVYVIDNLSTGRRKNLPNKCNFFKFDLLDKKKLGAFFEKYKIKDIFHLAACTSVTESEINPKKYYNNNIVATQNIIELNMDLYLWLYHSKISFLLLDTYLFDNIYFLNF